jgi:FkbM family methyltransferase
MQKFKNWHIPDYDTHFREYLSINGNNYQKEPRDHALSQVTQFRTALDIGGNVGFWSKDMCERFQRVEIFEPDLSNTECLRLNLDQYKNYTLHEVGLSNENKNKEFYKSEVSSGGHTFHQDTLRGGAFSVSVIEVKTLDSYHFTDVDFIKIDTQGSELDILQGAKRTLLQNDCVLNIEIEQKNQSQVAKGKPIFAFMESIGYRTLTRFKRDEVLFAKRKR